MGFKVIKSELEMNNVQISALSCASTRSDYTHTLNPSTEKGWGRSTQAVNVPTCAVAQAQAF